MSEYQNSGYYGQRFDTNIEGPHPRRKFKLIVVAIVLLILIIAIVLYIATAPSNTTVTTTTRTQASATTTTTAKPVGGEGSVDIKKILFASKIYEDYKYETRNSNQYKRGESVIIYFEVSGISNRQNMYGTFDINLVERVELRDPSGNRIPELSYLIDDNILETSPTQNYVKPFEYFFNLLQSDALGKYTQTIVIEDKNTGKFARKDIVFEVVE
jgi:hypothetical protein